MAGWFTVASWLLCNAAVENAFLPDLKDTSHSVLHVSLWKYCVLLFLHVTGMPISISYHLQWPDTSVFLTKIIIAFCKKWQGIDKKQHCHHLGKYAGLRRLWNILYVFMSTHTWSLPPPKVVLECCSFGVSSAQFHNHVFFGVFFPHNSNAK